MWSIKKHYEYTKGKFSFADFIGITKMKFTGNNGSKEAFVGVGLEFDTPFLSGFHVNIFRQRVIDFHHIFQQILADTYKGKNK